MRLRRHCGAASLPMSLDSLPSNITQAELAGERDEIQKRIAAAIIVTAEQHLPIRAPIIVLQVTPLVNEGQGERRVSRRVMPSPATVITCSNRFLCRQLLAANAHFTRHRGTSATPTRSSRNTSRRMCWQVASASGGEATPSLSFHALHLRDAPVAGDSRLFPER